MRFAKAIRREFRARPVAAHKWSNWAAVLEITVRPPGIVEINGGVYDMSWEVELRSELEPVIE